MLQEVNDGTHSGQPAASHTLSPAQDEQDTILCSVDAVSCRCRRVSTSRVWHRMLEENEAVESLRNAPCASARRARLLAEAEPMAAWI